jgi:NADH:ubiquinone oxidoreductase subunit C
VGRGLKDTYGEVTVTVPRELIADACRFLKTENGFDMLADLNGADRGPKKTLDLRLFIIYFRQNILIVCG